MTMNKGYRDMTDLTEMENLRFALDQSIAVLENLNNKNHMPSTAGALNYLCNVYCDVIKMPESEAPWAILILREAIGEAHIQISYINEKFPQSSNIGFLEYLADTLNTYS